MVTFTYIIFWGVVHMKDTNNGVSIFGWALLILGIMIGGIMISQYNEIIGISIVTLSILFGVLFIALGQIISNQQEIINKYIKVDINEEQEQEKVEIVKE
jgi:4-amino-4-deoxy-L-arabinose transferase-like glycosyltransferase